MGGRIGGEKREILCQIGERGAEGFLQGNLLVKMKDD
jgi:hypothetical protein